MPLSVFDVEKFCDSKYGKNHAVCQIDRFEAKNTIFQINDLVYIGLNCKDDTQDARFILPVKIKETKIVDANNYEYKGTITDATPMVSVDYCKKDIETMLLFTNKNIFKKEKV